MTKSAKIGVLAVYPAKGGLETISIPGNTTLGRLQDGTNFIIDISGSKKKHPGVVRQDDKSYALAPDGYAKGAFDYWRNVSSVKTQRVVLVGSGRVFAGDSNGAYTDITGSFTIEPTDNVSIENFIGIVVFAFENNPGGAPLRWNQSGVLTALGGTPPNVSKLRQWRNRMFGIGDPAAPDTVYHSAIENVEDWTVGGGGGSVQIDLGDQDPVGNTAIFPGLFGRMVVAKRRSLHELTPLNSTFAVRPLTTGHGCISHYAVVSLDNDIIYPSDRGIHSLAMTDKYGEMETAFLSSPIHDYYQEIVSFDDANNMRAVYDTETNAYLLALTSKGSAENDIVLGYNFNIGEWFKWEENVCAFAKYVDANDRYKSKILVYDSRGRVGVLDTTKSGRTTTWFGERRTMSITTGLMFPLGPSNEVTFRELKVFCKPSVPGAKLIASYFVDGTFVDDLELDMAPNSTGSLIGSSVIGVGTIGRGGGRVKTSTRQMRGVGSAVEFVFTHIPVSDGDDCEIYGYSIEYEYASETDIDKTQ